MTNLIKKETAFKARILQRTSQDKYKLSIYSDKLKKELGIFFVQDKNIDITDDDISKVIHFKATLAQNNGKYYVNDIKELRRDRITYSRNERRSNLSKYMNNEFYEFSGKYNYTREHDNRALFTDVKFNNGKNELVVDHLNIIVNKDLEEDKIYTFKAKIVQYQKEHASGYFYGVAYIKNVKEVTNSKKTKKVKKIKKDKKSKKEYKVLDDNTITITRKEYYELIEIKETLKKLKSLIL